MPRKQRRAQDQKKLKGEKPCEKSSLLKNLPVKGVRRTGASSYYIFPAVQDGPIEKFKAKDVPDVQV